MAAPSLPLPEDDTAAALLMELCDCYREWLIRRYPPSAPPEPKPDLYDLLKVDRESAHPFAQT
jgi:hypothetical protein